MNFDIVPYDQSYQNIWDEFCNNSINATFLHTRNFLSYHGNKFTDTSVIVLESGVVIGLFPSAISLSDSKLVVSHPGASYGGIIHKGRLYGERMIKVLSSIFAYYKNNNFEKLLYKSIPEIYSLLPAQDDLYALFRLGAERVRTDLSCTIRLSNRISLSGRRLRGLKKAEKYVSLISGSTLLPEFWKVVEDNLERKHSTKPVHSYDEINLLSERFAEQIKLYCATIDGNVEAGVLIFISNRVWHAQYIAASKPAYKVSALDAVFSAVISDAEKAGAEYFDFGISTDMDGKYLNAGLYDYKHGFGCGGTIHEFYSIQL